MKVNEMDEKELKEIDDTILGFGNSLTSLLDHFSILSWVNYMGHKCNVGITNKNFDGRDFIVFPSGRKVVITIKIEEYQE